MGGVLHAQRNEKECSITDGRPPARSPFRLATVRRRRSRAPSRGGGGGRFDNLTGGKSPGGIHGDEALTGDLSVFWRRRRILTICILDDGFDVGRTRQRPRTLEWGCRGPIEQQLGRFRAGWGCGRGMQNALSCCSRCITFLKGKAWKA